MTPDIQAAAGRLAALIDDPDRHLYSGHRVNRALVPLDERDVADLRLLLAALDELLQRLESIRLIASALPYAIGANPRTENAQAVVASLRRAIDAHATLNPAEQPTDACQHCPDGHTDPNTRPWSVWVTQTRIDGQPPYLEVAPSNGAHVAESDAEWLREVIRRARAGRHRPLTDQPIDRIPTPRGRDALNAYRTHHTRQQRPEPAAAVAHPRHPLRSDEGYSHHLACPWHPDRAGIFATALGALCRDCWASNYPQAVPTRASDPPVCEGCRLPETNCACG